MGLVEIGTNGFMDADSTPIARQRTQLVRDLREAYDTLGKIGLSLDDERVRVLASVSARALCCIVQTIGYPKTMQLLSLLNNIAQRNGKYMEAAKSNLPEHKKFCAQLKTAFKDVRSARASVAMHGCVVRAKMGGIAPLIALVAAGATGILWASRAHASTNSAPSKQALLDFFVRYNLGTGKSRSELDAAAALAMSLGLPKTSAAIRSDSGLPQDEMWPGTTINVAIYVKAYVRDHDPLGLRPADPTAAAKWDILTFMVKYGRWKVLKTGAALSSNDFVSASAAASRLGLPITAAAIRSDAGLPTYEIWPGSNLSVDAYVREFLTKYGVVIPQRPIVTPPKTMALSQLVQKRGTAVHGIDEWSLRQPRRVLPSPPGSESNPLRFLGPTPRPGEIVDVLSPRPPRQRVVPDPFTAKQMILKFFVKYAQWKIQRLPGHNAPSREEFSAASQAASSLNLPETSAGIASESGLPRTEIWPGSKLNVDTFVRAYLNKVGIPVAMTG